MTGVGIEDLDIATTEELIRLNLLKSDRPTLTAIVLGLAIKYPYGDSKGGKLAHAYRWRADHLKRFLQDGGDDA